MTLKDQLKIEIDRLDERALELLYKIACQLPHIPEENQDRLDMKDIVSLFQEIANSGGLGIEDPSEWQRETRQDRSLPLRGFDVT